MKKSMAVFLTFCLILCLFFGCKPMQTIDENTNHKNGTSVSDTSNENSAVSSAPVDADFSQTASDMFTNSDEKTDYDAEKSVTILLNGATAEASSDSVKISGSTVQITEEATYVISGTLTDGSIIVNTTDTAKPHIVLNGVDITSKTFAALYVLEADKVFVTLAEGSTNRLANENGFTAIDENNVDGAIYSKQDLTFNGSGSLAVTSPGGHGIVCKDDLVFTGGSYTVHSASHGLDANDSVRIKAAVINVDAGKDIIHCENSDDASKGFVYIQSGTVNGEAEGDAISASSYLQIEGGTFDLLAGGGAENGSKASSGNYGGFMGKGPGGNNTSSSSSTDTVSMKGLKAANSILISDGTFTLDSADDGIHSDVSVTIRGGTFNIATGDDALHAEDTLTITSGKINISESYEGLEALHIDVQGGEIRLVASDDGLNAAGGTDSSGTEGGRDGMFGGGRPGGGGFGGMSSNSNGSIKISGGTLYINSSGDGLDANGTLEISGGYTLVVGPTRGDTATLDYDKSGVITGGTFIGTGAAGMAQTFSDSEQGVIALSVGTQAANTKITVKDQGGNVILEHSPELDFAVVILSSPDLKQGETYTVFIGSKSGEFEAS